MITEKYCKGCKKNHPIEEFGKLKKSPDGYASRCKAWQKANYRKTPERPEGVDKVCPLCLKHTYVDPTSKEGYCQKCGVHYYLSPSWTATNGIDIWIPHQKNLKAKVISYLEEHETAYKSEIAHKINVCPSSVHKVVSKLKQDGILKENRIDCKVYVELAA